MQRPLRWATAATAASAMFLAGLVWELSVSRVASDAWYAVSFVAVGSVPMAMGWLVLRHARGPGGSGGAVVGALLCWMGLLPFSGAFSDLYVVQVERAPDSLPVASWLVGGMSTLWTGLYLVPALLLLHFPDGRLPTPRWRWVPRALVAAMVMMFVLGVVGPGPNDPPFDDEIRFPRFPWTVPPALEVLFGILAVLSLLTLFGGLVASAVSVWLRRRRAAEVTLRAQLRWISLAAMGLPLTLLLCWTSYFLLRGPDLVVVGLVVTWIALPVATWIAMVHHDLYNVDRLTATAVTWTAVMAVLLLGYTVAAVTVGTLLGRRAPIAATLATLVLALALAPLRPRLGRRVDRWLYPARARLRTDVEHLLADVRSGTTAPEQLEATLRRALAEPALRVGFVVPGSPVLHATDGRPLAAPAPGARRSEHRPDDAATGAPIVLGEHLVGRVDGISPASAALLHELREPIALVAEMARLRIELTTALRQTEESRRRLQSVGYAERRKLERDLHDGAQQRLVSLGMNLRVAQRHLAPTDTDVQDLIDTTVAELGTAVSELRQLAHGIRPSCLDDGLGAALASLTEAGPVPVTVVVRAGQLPDDVTATAYYVVMEAVTNAIKHAGASRIEVAVEQHEAVLAVRVCDDGRGGADQSGAGWSGLRDRITAVGGSLAVHSPPEAGTRVEVLLPCA
ncbi:MAG TPA: histidine kinase [Segeticoccus sp.]|uniref:sensor histidine kinase n=1 Tax=Segeticoccus sp. TaxID=2706531 RepID=UPI002D80352C|nr:histidine kinase [Segeticoccus sp.]HET8600146.1 histidine kinase [Segeticoccus sp.]